MMSKITSVTAIVINKRHAVESDEGDRSGYLSQVCGNWFFPAIMRSPAAFSAFILVLCAGIQGPVKSEDLSANAKLQPVVLERISPGTAVFDKTNRGMSDLILFVKGKLEAGDVDAVTDTVKYYGDLFNLVYMANTKKGPAGFELDTIKVGFSSKIGGQDVVVNSATASTLGLSLNLIGRSVLSGNERALEDIVIVARNQQSAVVDAPAVVRFQNRNQKMTVRFFIWVSVADGRVGTTAWLLSGNADDYSFAEDKFNFLPPEMIEERILYVDGSQFTFGIPSATAFAMTDIPQGRSFAMTERFKRVGANELFTPQTFKELIAAIADAIGQPESSAQ